MCPGDLTVVRVQTTRTNQFYLRPVQKPDPQPLGRPNSYPYTLIRVFGRVRLDMSVPISSSAFQVFQFMVAFRYPNVNHKILTFAHYCLFWCIGRLYYHKRETHSLPYPEYDCQRSVNDSWSYILESSPLHWANIENAWRMAFSSL